MSWFKSIRHPHQTEHVPDPYAGALKLANKRAPIRKALIEELDEQAKREGRR